MRNYRNQHGNSGVIAFDDDYNYIKVLFKNKWLYTYTIESAGAFNIARMKQLAHKGRGLSTYISVVHPVYESREPIS